MNIYEIPEQEFVDKYFTLMAEVECGAHFVPDNEQHRAWVRKRIALHYLRGTQFFALSDDSDAPIGFAAVLYDPGLPGVSCFGQSAELLDIAIFPQYRGQGHGSILLRHVERIMETQRVFCLYMTTYGASYGAIAFYGKHGYAPVAVLPDVYGPNDEGRVYIRKRLRDS